MALVAPVQAAEAVQMPAAGLYRLAQRLAATSPAQPITGSGIWPGRDLEAAVAAQADDRRSLCPGRLDGGEQTLAGHCVRRPVDDKRVVRATRTPPQQPRAHAQRHGVHRARQPTRGRAAGEPHAQRQALEAGVRKSGYTVHFVDAGVDTGAAVVQRRVPVLSGDTEAALTARILAEEHRSYPEAVRLVLSGQVTYKPDGKASSTNAKSDTKTDGVTA